MKDGDLQIVGIKKSEKDGNVSYTIHALTNFETWENGKGLKVVSEWTRADLSNIEVNSICTPIYGRGYQGKAVLKGLQVVK